MLRGAIVGFGNVAQFGHWPAYAESRDAEIVAVVDESAERCATALALNPELRVCDSVEQLGGDVQFIDICTPPARHAEPMLQAIARGWHVLCEKPFLLDRETLDEVRTRAAAASVAAMPVHNWKYAPIIRRASDLVRGDAVGQLRRVEIVTLRKQHAAAALAQVNWRRDPRMAGGGIVLDHGWHAFYLAMHFFQQRPIEVEAELHRAEATSVEDEARVRLTFASGEVSIELSWNASERTNQLRLIGDAGEIAIDDDTLEVNGHVTRFDGALSAGSHHPDWFAAMLPDVLASFREPRLSGAAFEEAAACLEIAQRAYAKAIWRSN